MVGQWDGDEANTSVVRLDISGNLIDDQGASALADALMATLALCAYCSSGLGEVNVALDVLVHDEISSWRGARRGCLAVSVEFVAGNCRPTDVEAGVVETTTLAFAILEIAQIETSKFCTTPRSHR